MTRNRESLIKDLVKIYLHLGVDQDQETKAIISEELAIKLQALGIGFNDKKMLDKIFNKAMAEYKKETLEELRNDNKRLVEEETEKILNAKTDTH